MELKEFVKSTISDIVNAVIELQEDFVNKDVGINPLIHDEVNTTKYKGQGYNHVQYIEMTVVISANEQKNTGGSGGISVVGFSAKASVSGDTKENRNENTVKFRIPVSYPNPEYQ